MRKNIKPHVRTIDLKKNKEVKLINRRDAAEIVCTFEEITFEV